MIFIEDIKYCVYVHINKYNGKKYVGITKNHQKRWRKGEGYSGQYRFYYAIRKYGWDNFKHIILKRNLSLEEAYELEKAYIKEYDSIYNGYNISEGGKPDIQKRYSTKRAIDEQVRKNIENLPHNRIIKTISLAIKIDYGLTDREEETIYNYYLKGNEYKNEFLELKTNMENKMIDNEKKRRILEQYLKEKETLFATLEKYQRSKVLDSKIKELDEKYTKILGGNPLEMRIKLK